MMKTPIFDKGPRGSLTAAVLALATVAIQQTKAQDEEFVDPSNPAIAAEVLQVPDVQDLGKRSADLRVKLLVTLRFNHAAELHQLIREQSDPASSNYHRYLTPAEFVERFGPTVDQLNQVVTELTRAGFQVTETSSNRLLVHASAPSASKQLFRVLSHHSHWLDHT